MARLSRTPGRSKTRSGWRTAAVVGAGALITAAAVRRAYAKKRTNREQLQMNDRCDIQSFCPQTCGDPTGRLTYRQPVLSHAALVSQGDSLRLSSLRIQFNMVAQFTAATTCEDFALETLSPYIVRAALCKQVVDVATDLPPLVDLLNDQVWSDLPSIRRWEWVHLGMNASLTTVSSPLVLQQCGATIPARPPMKGSASIKTVVLNEFETLNLWITYGGLGVTGDETCTPAMNGRLAVPVGLLFHGRSQAYVEL